MQQFIRTWMIAGFALFFVSATPAQDGIDELRRRLVPPLWRCSAPLVAAEDREQNRSHAQKDPSIVFFEGRWHLFMTVKLQGRSVIEYCTFEDWSTANEAERVLLNVSERDYFCAPQVFYFEPHQLWYLIYQVGVSGQQKMWVAYSTTPDITDPRSWTQAQPILDGGPDDPRKKGGLDYWIICDETTAHLFITTNDGHMWRLETSLAEFPKGFRNLSLALQGDIFEASHTYKILGMNKYLTIIEANGQRYYKAYLADTLDGEWTPLAATREQPFASARNVRPQPGVPPWTDNISHGELIRAGFDQRLIVDPSNMRFLFQGMWNRDKTGGYGSWNWRLGLLTPEWGQPN